VKYDAGQRRERLRRNEEYRGAQAVSSNLARARDARRGAFKLKQFGKEREVEACAAHRAPLGAQGVFKRRRPSMKRVLAMMAAGALASTALAGFTLTGLSGNSAGPAGSPLNTVITYVYTGPEFEIGSFVFEGDLTKVHPATYASEARFKITNPRRAGRFHAGPDDDRGLHWHDSHRAGDDRRRGCGVHGHHDRYVDV